MDAMAYVFLLTGLFLFIIWITTYHSPQMIGNSIRRIKTKQKVIALTFDDGPNPLYTIQLLDILKKHSAQATFFVIGERAKKYPEIIKNIYSVGHEIGNHSWSHALLLGKSFAFIREEIEKTDTLLRSLGYTKEIYFRSPYGLKFFVLPWVLFKMNKKNILFNILAWDWLKPGKKWLTFWIVKRATPGSIILLHDGMPNDDLIAAVDEILTKLTAKGFQFVTISELIAAEGK